MFMKVVHLNCNEYEEACVHETFIGIVHSCLCCLKCIINCMNLPFHYKLVHRLSFSFNIECCGFLLGSLDFKSIQSLMSVIR